MTGFSPRVGEQTGEIHANPFETMISVSLSDYNLKGNELLDVVFWEMNSLDGSEIANTEVMSINLSEWTGIPSSAFVPESLSGLKFRIFETMISVYHDESLELPPIFRDRSVTLGLDGSALIDGHPGEYEYTKDDNLGKLQLNWHKAFDPNFNDGNGSRRLDPAVFYFEAKYELYFDSEYFGHGSFTMQDDFGVQNGWVDFEIIQHGWGVHSFSYDEITELTGLTSIENAVAGEYVLHYSGGINGQSEGYLEPVYPATFSIFYETNDTDDWLRVDLEKYPEYAPEQFVSTLPKVGYKFYQDYFSLPRKAKDFLERNYRWENGTPIGYWEEERLGYDELGNSEVEYVAHLDSGIQVIFYPNGEFSYEYDPYKRERDAGLTFNSLASNYGSQRLGFWNRESEGQDPVYVSEGPNPVYVDIRRIDGNVSEQNSLMYRISLLNRFVGEDETPSLEDYDLSGTDFPAGTPVTLTINYESDDPRYFIVSGSEVSGFKNRYPESWLGTPAHSLSRPRQ